jgi:predicted ATP-dependent protease
MSGRIHDKGVHILSGFLSALLAKQHHMGIAASVCFEQSYGLIDGDSASITELTAIVSALARLPIKQNLAMTGSLNQFGEVQPIGGVNEKIEGFWRTVELLGKKAETYKVLIPIQNAPNLMVHKKVRQAVKDGLLEIIPVVSFAQVFELATGVPFGVEDIYEERFSEGSALWIIEQRLKEIRESKKRERQKSK